MACVTLPCPMQYPACIRHVLHTGNYKWAKPSCRMALVQSQIEWRHATLALLPRFPPSLSPLCAPSLLFFFPPPLSSPSPKPDVTVYASAKRSFRIRTILTRQQNPALAHVLSVKLSISISLSILFTL